MNKRLLSLPFLLLLFQQVIVAQVTPPCPVPPPPGAESCPTTCVYCNFDGYMGVNNGTPSGGNVVCGQIFLHNDQWFGFVAGTECITINIATSNCNDGNGLQAAFFDACDAPDAITCNPGSGGGEGQPLELSYCGFVPGQTYYLMIDGWTGDVCDYEIEVLDGSVTPPASGQPPVPVGPTQVCPGAVVVYTIPPVPGAGYYQWTTPPGSKINDSNSNNQTFQAPEGTTITVTYGNLGGNVCVRVGNACSQPLQSCLAVTNKVIPPTVKPKIVICPEDLPFSWDEQPFNTITLPGVYNLTSTPYDSYLGCDSIVKQTVEVKLPTTTNIGTKYICEGDCFVFDGNSYCNAGTFTAIIPSFFDCDSAIQFTIVKVPAVAVIQPVTPIDCNSPALQLNSSGSTNGPSIQYTWSNASWTTIGNQATQNVNSTGTYHLVITNNFAGAACKDTAAIQVTGNTTPPGAVAQGGNLTCIATTVTLQGSSQTNGVNYQWTGPGITPANQNQQNPTVNAIGIYTLTVSNPVNGCTSTATATVSGDITPPTASAMGGTITCLQTSVTITSTTNAPTPSYNWSGPGINAGNQTIPNPNVTAQGTYNVTITNTVNGCTATASTAVNQDNALPTASAGADKTITCLLPSVTLNGAGSAGAAPVNFGWTGAGINAGNQNSPTPSVNQPDTYILTVTNPANGCFKKDTVVVDANVTPPVASAGADQTLTCAVTTVTLGGSGSSQGADFTANWNGPGINAGNQNQYNPVVSVQGLYTLTVTNTVNGCTSSEDVAVAQNIATPTANAGVDQILTCTSPNGVTLNGSGSPAGVNFLWTGLGIGANNETQQTPTVTLPDTYTLQVTNPVNGCTHTDQVVVTQDANVPVANAGVDLQLNCSVNTVNIDGSASSSGNGISYQWSGPGISGPNITAQSPSNITVPGTYTLTVTNSNNNCINTDIVVIEQDITPPVASAGNNVTLNCFNSATDTLDASASSNGANFVLLWSGPGITPANQNDVMPVVNAPGVYTLLVTNTDNTCTATAQTTVANDLTPPIADAGADKTIDCVTTSTTIGGNSSAGVSFAYLWTGPGITPAIETLAQPVVSLPGTYQIVVTNNINGCTATNDVIVNTNAVFPAASAGPDGLLTCAQPAVVLNGSGSSSGASFQIVWVGPDISVINQNQVSPSITKPGTYILTVTNTTNSCVTKDTVVVDENKVIPAAAAGQDLKLDCQTLNVILDGSLSDTGSTIVYLWTGAGINAGNQNQQSPTVNQPGNYTLLVTDSGNGCTAQDAVTVNQDIIAPAASAGADFTLTCAQNSQAIDGSASSTGPNFTYIWQGPGINTGNFSVQNPVVADSGTYILIVTNNQNFCTATDAVYVALNGDFPLTEAGVDKTLTCQNDTLQLDGSQSQTGAGITYAWSGPGIVAGQAGNISPLVYLSGAYTLTVTNTTNGCSKTDIVNVNEDFIPPVADAGPDPTLTCANSATGVTLTSGGSSTGTGFSLKWSGPGITAANQNQPNPTVLVVGTYTLVVTNTTNGCTSSDQVTVTQDQNLPIADAGADQTLTCAAQTVVLDGTGSSTPGGGTLQYQWSGPGIAGNGSEATPGVSSAGVYTLTVFNPLTGCQASDNVEVFLDTQAPVLTITEDTLTCSDPQGTLSVTSSIPGTIYEWSGIGINQNNSHLATLQLSQPGLFTVVATAPNGCTVSETAILAIDDNFPEGTAEGAELNCFNNGVSAVGGEVSTPGATYFWTGPGGFQSDSLVATVTQPGVYVFNIVSPNGCVRKINVQVDANFAKPQVNAFVPELLDCNTTSLTISGAGTSVGSIFTYQWSSTGGNIVSGDKSLTPVVNKAGDYKLVVLNNLNGCKDSTTVQVAYDPEVPTAFDLAIQDIRCFGDDNGSIIVNDVNGGTEPFVFTLSGGSIAGNQYTGLTAGAYTLSLQDANGCLLDTLVTISEPSELLVDLGPDVVVQLGEEATVSAIIANTTPIQSVSWNFAPNCDSLAAQCLEFTYLPLQSYRHTITVVDENGCIVRDNVTVQVKRDRLIYVPNVINPTSADPLNSLLMIHGGTGVVKVRRWQIFDRWGEIIFTVEDFPTDDPAYAWNGRIKGDDAHTGVYVWFAEIEFLDGEVELFKGDVTIMR